MVLLHVHFEANTTDTLYNSVGLWLEVEFPFIPYFSHRSVLRPAPFCKLFANLNICLCHVLLNVNVSLRCFCSFARVLGEFSAISQAKQILSTLKKKKKIQAYFMIGSRPTTLMRCMGVDVITIYLNQVCNDECWRANRWLRLSGRNHC